MKLVWRIGCLAVLLLLATSGCHMVRAINAGSCNEIQGYMRETSAPPITIPAGLDAPDTTNALRLPQLNEPAPPPRTGKQPCLDAPPPFKVQQAARAPAA